MQDYLADMFSLFLCQDYEMNIVSCGLTTVTNLPSASVIINWQALWLAVIDHSIFLTFLRVITLAGLISSPLLGPAQVKFGREGVYSLLWSTPSSLSLRLFHLISCSTPKFCYCQVSTCQITFLFYALVLTQEHILSIHFNSST